MNTLPEIQAAAELLSPEQKQELLIFLHESLRGTNSKVPLPRDFSNDQIARWIEQDEADLRAFKTLSS